jgi:DNA-binding CsgD family transcriptional regulator
LKTPVVPTYQDYLTLLAAQPQPNAWDSAECLKEAQAKHAHLDVSSVAVFMLDYQTRRYPLLTPTTRRAMGHPTEAFQEGGLEFMLYHRQDFEVFSTKMFPDEVRFIAQQAPADLALLRFSKSFRFKNDEGKYRTILQRNTILNTGGQAAPTAIFGTAQDITEFAEPGKIVHHIERHDPATQRWVLLLAKEYYPDVAPERLLSHREVEILRWAVEGLSSKQIAAKLHLSFNTVNTHRRNMLRKTNCQNSLELLRYAIERKLL